MTEFIDTSAVVVIKTTYHMQCPVCNDEMDIDWWVTSAKEKLPAELPLRGDQCCKECDSTYSVSVEFNETGEAVIGYAQVPSTQYHGLMLVKRPNDEVYMVVDTCFYVREGEVDMDLHYYIDEHTCPTNWLDVVMVAEDGDPDPHGVFTFVRGITYKQAQSLYGYSRGLLRGEEDDSVEHEEAILRVFPEIQLGGQIYEGELENRLPAPAKELGHVVTHNATPPTDS